MKVKLLEDTTKARFSYSLLTKNSMAGEQRRRGWNTCATHLIVIKLLTVKELGKTYFCYGTIFAECNKNMAVMRHFTTDFS